MISAAVHFFDLQLVAASPPWSSWRVMTKGGSMKVLALLTAVALTLTVAGCAQYGGPFLGKGKAPPPAAPVVTKG